jgi:hypothetical protein
LMAFGWVITLFIFINEIMDQEVVTLERQWCYIKIWMEDAIIHHSAYTSFWEKSNANAKRFMCQVLLIIWISTAKEPFISVVLLWHPWPPGSASHDATQW